MSEQNSEQNIDKQLDEIKTIWGSLKNCLNLVREKKYLGAIKEAIALLRLLYQKSLKGKYVNIKGIRVSYTALTIIALVFAWIALPSSDVKEVTSKTEAASSKEDTNVYNKNDIKVYNLQKCNDNGAVCGLLENGSENDIAGISVSVAFHDRDGNVVYMGEAVARDVKTMSRIKFTIPSAQPFDYFVLSKVTIE